MLTNLEAFIEYVKKSGWNIRQNRKGDVTLPKEVVSRYKNLPAEYLEFMGAMRTAVSPEGTAWFLLEEEFTGKEVIMQWNEYELVALKDAEDKGESYRMAKIVKFWDSVLPVFMSVGEGHAYFGIDTSDNNRIVFGFEPDFHTPQVVAESFDELLGLFVAGEIELAE